MVATSFRKTSGLTKSALPTNDRLLELSSTTGSSFAMILALPKSVILIRISPSRRMLKIHESACKVKRKKIRMK